jgi:hypothetical protein
VSAIPGLDVLEGQTFAKGKKRLLEQTWEGKQTREGHWTVIFSGTCPNESMPLYFIKWIIVSERSAITTGSE